MHSIESINEMVRATKPDFLEKETVYHNAMDNLLLYESYPVGSNPNTEPFRAKLDVFRNNDPQRIVDWIQSRRKMIEPEPEKSQFTEKAMADVLAEREAQESKWGEQNHDPFTYLTILGEEYGECCEAALESRFCGKPIARLREEAVQAAAVAMAIVECIDREKWRWPEVKTEEKGEA